MSDFEKEMHKGVLEQNIARSRALISAIRAAGKLDNELYRFPGPPYRSDYFYHSCEIIEAQISFMEACLRALQ